MTTAATKTIDPKRYFESVQADRDVPEHEPVCLYLETTNRCNLLCTTCPRTYEELEPPADMSWNCSPRSSIRYRGSIVRCCTASASLCW